MKSKNILSLLAAIMIFVPACIAQTVPNSVKQQFSKKFPKATEVAWDKESDSEYEASFKIKNVKYSANFATDGSWLETEQAISFKELPDAVLATLSRDYYGVKINEVAKLMNNKNETFFEVEIEKMDTEKENYEEDHEDNDEHGSEEYSEDGEEDEMAIDLIFDTSGKIIKKVSFEKENKD